MFNSQLVSALAVVGLAAAQSSSLCSQPTATINAQADAAQYTSCTTIDGDVLIGTGATTISLDGPGRITGSLIAHNAGGLTSLGSATLSSIATIDLFNLTTLSTFSFTELTAVSNISWVSLPILSTLTLPAVISSAKDLLVSNTFLSSLEGINLMTADTMDINNNDRLTTFSTQVANVSSMINIAANGQNLAVEFPNLIWADNLIVRNVSTLMIPSLAAVNSSFGLYENYFTNVSMPNLTSVGNVGSRTGGFAIVANPALTNLTVPSLSKVGGAVQVANNTALTDIAFPKLATVGGAINLLGNFSNFSLPSISNIQGGAVIESTEDIDSSCASLKSSEGNAIQGPNTCTGQVATPASTGTPTGTAGGSSSSPTSKKNAAMINGVNEVVAGLTVVGTVVKVLFL